jgi:hypothetical protein
MLGCLKHKANLAELDETFANGRECCLLRACALAANQLFYSCPFSGLLTYRVVLSLPLFFITRQPNSV